MNKNVKWLLAAAVATSVLAQPAWSQSRLDPSKPNAELERKAAQAESKGGSASVRNAQTSKSDVGARQLSPEEVEKLKAAEEMGKQVESKDPANPAKPQALQLSATSHDWGAISDDTVVNHTFQAKNISDRTIKIAVAASCGCTVSKLDKDVIAPGEEVPITASFNPQGRSGPQTKTLTITVTDPQGEFAQQFISISSNVRPMMAVEPNRTFLQEVDHRQGKQERITVTGRKPGFAVQSVESNNEFVKATIGESVTSQENGEEITRVEVLLDIGKGAPIGTLNAQLTIRSNDATAKPLSTFAGAEIIGDVRANPASTMIRANAPGSLISADIRVDTRSGKAFRVTGIDLETRHDMRMAVDLKPDAEDGTSYTVTISGLAPLQAGLIQGTMLVSTDSEGGETIRIPFTATVPRPTQPQPTRVGNAAPAARPNTPSATSAAPTPLAQPVSLSPQPAAKK